MHQTPNPHLVLGHHESAISSIFSLPWDSPNLHFQKYNSRRISLEWKLKKEMPECIPSVSSFTCRNGWILPYFTATSSPDTPRISWKGIKDRTRCFLKGNVTGAGDKGIIYLLIKLTNERLKGGKKDVYCLYFSA